eukprot:scaffold35567_cov137-Amphora_coffeaeformis.AAC.1
MESAPLPIAACNCGHPPTGDMTSGGFVRRPRSCTGSSSSLLFCKSSRHSAGDFRRLTNSLWGTARPVAKKEARCCCCWALHKSRNSSGALILIRGTHDW